MSHEGIRFVSEDAARKTAQEEAREFTSEALDPARVRVDKTGGAGLDILWKDGHQSHWSFAWLRDACPCATCVEERERLGREPGEPSQPASTLLPIYHPPVRPETVAPVGRYAISFHWNDGHQSGIFSWDYLRRHCQCPMCRG